MFNKLLVALILILGSAPAFAQVNTSGTMSYDRTQSGWDASKYTPYDTSCCILRSDCCRDGKLNIKDLTCLAWCMFIPGDWCCPECPEECDTNGNGTINVQDLMYLVNFLFKGGPPPWPCPARK